MVQRGALIVVSGFAGAGKGTIVKRMLANDPNFALSISMTTRNPRNGEENGREYFFVTKEEFEDAIAKDLLLEHACYVGNYYGTPRRYVEEMLGKGRDVILEIEAQGALQIKDKFPDAVLVFITPPGADVLKQRLEGRGTETPEVVAKRMHRASEEAELIEKYDFLLVNDDIDKCTDEMLELVRACHHAPECNQVFLERLKEELKAFALRSLL